MRQTKDSGRRAENRHSGNSSRNHRAVRQAHATERAEDYCEAVAELIAEKGSARVTEIAARIGVSHVTAIRIVQRLGREGLLEIAPYRSVGLTQSGRNVAERAAERHRIVYAFLRSVGVSHGTACRDAEGIEHHVSAETLRIFKRHVLIKS